MISTFRNKGSKQTGAVSRFRQPVKWLAVIGFILALLSANWCSYAGPGAGPCPEKVFPPAEQAAASKTFVIYTCLNDLQDFRKLAEQAARLKPYGRVQINISTLADKDFKSVPKENSPWHEYASYNPTPFKFFPDPKIAPFLDADFVRRNRQLMLEKAAILKRYGLEAAFFGYEPNFLPAAFFDAYPQMLGPRVDHPRRSNRPAFAPCVSVLETRQMYSNMMEQMLKTVPAIKTFYFKTNDAGTGICWSDWLYSGPNGSTLCKGQSTGQRVALLMNAYKKGAEKAGQPIDIYLSEGSSNFSDSEKTDIQQHLPEHCYYQSTDVHNIINIAGLAGFGYPVTGLVDPVAFLNGLRGLNGKPGQTVFINLRVSYERGNESLEASDLLFSMLESQLKEPVADKAGSLQKLRTLCAAWGGQPDAEALCRAFLELHAALESRSRSTGRVSPLNWDVAARLINRPLLVAPQRLSPKEESYFLPFVFNVSEQEARMDYTDIQGGRQQASRDDLLAYAQSIKEAARPFDSLDANVPKHRFLKHMATALRIYASLMRSCGNFAGAQAIRDSNAEKLNGPAHRPDKQPTWTGDPGFIKLTEIMRDELDNTQELIGLLQHGGGELLCLAKDPAHGDTFLLGPDLLNQLKQKRRIMLDHWMDIQDYLASPFK
jgi:hypothetical protein